MKKPIENAEYSEIEDLLIRSIKEIDNKIQLKYEQDFSDLDLYIKHSEYGIAYELLIYILDKEVYKWPSSLEKAGAKMNLYP